MPTSLYYTKPDDLLSMMLNGGTQQFPEKNNSALETVYRINVGGRQIPPADDTGMFRNWHTDIDNLKSGERPYSVSAGFGLEQELLGHYKDYPNYTAPDDVYLSARNYGMNETSNFHVTWKFQVDSMFTYMVRLHFCEFDEKIEKAGDRVFQIFINDALVEAFTDVMLWTQRLVPVHRDYAVWMLPSEGSLKKINLSIKLQPHPAVRSFYRDVSLNGIEILKISNFKNDSLAGPNPDPLPSPPVSSIIVVATSGFIVLSYCFVDFPAIY